FSRDWSSDVCSSDLHEGEFQVRVLGNGCFGLPLKQQVVAQTGFEVRHDIARNQVAAVVNAHATFHTMANLGAHTHHLALFGGVEIGRAACRGRVSLG